MDAIFRDAVTGAILASFELTPGDGRPIRNVEVEVGAFDDLFINVEFDVVEDEEGDAA